MSNSKVPPASLLRLSPVHRTRTRRISLETLDDEQILGEFDAKHHVDAASSTAIVLQDRHAQTLAIGTRGALIDVPGGIAVVGANERAFFVTTDDGVMRCDWQASCSPLPFTTSLALAADSVAESNDAAYAAAIERREDAEGGRLVLLEVATGTEVDVPLPFAPYGIHWVARDYVVAYAEPRRLSPMCSPAKAPPLISASPPRRRQCHPLIAGRDRRHVV